MGYLLLALAGHDVLEEVDRQVVAVAEVSFRVDSEECINLSLRAELGAEGSGCDFALLGVDLLHEGVL